MSAPVHPANARNLTAELVPLAREPHKKRPGCDVRSARQRFDWCDQPAKWSLGDQHLCDVCAAILVFSNLSLEGIWSDGIWPQNRVKADA